MHAHETSDGWVNDAANLREFETYILKTYSRDQEGMQMRIDLKIKESESAVLKNLTMDETWWENFRERYKILDHKYRGKDGDYPNGYRIAEVQEVQEPDCQKSDSAQRSPPRIPDSPVKTVAQIEFSGAHSLKIDQKYEIYLYKIRNPQTSFADMVFLFSGKFQARSIIILILIMIIE